MSTLLGNNAKPTSTQEWTGINTLNQQSHALVLPAGGPWRVTRLGAWMAGKDAAVTTYLVLRFASGAIAAQSASFSAVGHPYGSGNSDSHEADLVAPYTFAGGTTVHVGWSRNPAGAAQWGRYASGSHLDDTATGSYPQDLTGFQTDNGGDISAYLYYEAANTAPTVPTLNSPVGGALVTTTTPVLNFTPHDPDGDAHTEYTYQIDNDSGFGSPVESASVAGSFADAVAINRTVLSALTPGTTYYWRVKTKDAVGYGPYSAAGSFVVNANPNVPSSLSPTGNAVIIGTDLTPNLSFLYSDPNAHNSSFKQVQVATDSGFTALVFDSGKTAVVQANNTTIVTTCTATLVRGTTYYWRAKVWDAYGFVSAYSTGSRFRVNSLPVGTLLTPNDASLKLAKMVLTAGVGWTAPRMSITWSYSDAQSQAQTQYELEVITDNAGAPTGAIKVSGVVASSASTVVPVPATDYVENTRYHVRVRVFDGLEWSAWSGFFICRVRWGLSTYRKDVSISGAAPTAWLVIGLNTTVISTSAVTVEYNSSDDGTANLGAWKADLSLTTKRKWVHYRAWMFAWGTSPATTPQLLDLTIQSSGYVAQPDFWLPSPIGAEGGSIELGKFAFGTQSLKMTGDGTEQLIRVQVRVEPDTLYMFQGRIESVGNSGATYRLSDTAAGASIFDVMVTPLAVDALMAQYVAGPWDSGNRAAVWIQARINGAADTAAYFDAVELAKGTVAKGYGPSPLGSGPGITGAPSVVDAGGVQIDASAGGILRLRGSGGTLADEVGLGVHGLTHGGVEGGIVPSGGIIMWKGQSTAIPVGWFLCDGANGTPDLRDRFIIGADATNEDTSGGTVSPSAALATHATHATHAAHTTLGAHAALALHQHELPFTFGSATATYRMAANTFGSGTSRSVTAQITTGSIASAAAAEMSEAVSGGTPDAHDPISAHGAHDAHGAHAVGKFYRMCFIMKS